MDNMVYAFLIGFVEKGITLQKRNRGNSQFVELILLTIVSTYC